MRACAAIKADGSRCRAIALTDSDYCHAHHPNRAGRRSRAASKAGKSGRAPSEIQTVKDELRFIAVAAPHSEEVKGYSVAVAAYHALLRALELERRLTETEEYGERLSAIEEKIGGRNRA